MTLELNDNIIDEIKLAVKPSAIKHLEKELFKVRIASQYIGTGDGNESSTERYRKVYEKYNLANTGNYSECDIIWVSSNGRRKNRFNPIQNNELQGVYKNIDIAISKNSLFVMDTKEHLTKTKRYNIGELQLAEYLMDNNYTRNDSTGVWAKISKL